MGSDARSHHHRVRRPNHRLYQFHLYVSLRPPRLCPYMNLQANFYVAASTATGTTPTTTASTTESPPPEVTAGAIPQQLKGSIAGLLGFFIVGLVVL
jgi:hypothetical protein